MNLRHALLAGIATVSIALLTVGCGGSTESAEPSATTSPAVTETQREGTPDSSPTGPPSLGCDVIPRCLGEWANAALARCPPADLDAEGRRLRAQLERQLARFTSIDLHNEQAYEASEAALAALDAFEQKCPL